MVPAALVILAFASSLPDPTKPRVVAKGDGYAVHLVPATSSTKDRAGRPMMVTHTRRDTGAMTILAEADPVPQFSGLGRDFMTYSWNTRGIAGVRADGERVYVLTTHSIGTSTPAMGARGTTTIELRVFWLADGARVGKWLVENAPVVHFDLRLAGERTTDAGPLKADLDGVSVLGESFRFKGKELVSRVADSPLSADAPELLASGAKFTIHAIKGRAATAAEHEHNVAGTAIIYVPLVEGTRARTLLQSGNREQKGEKDRPPTVTQTRIVGATADNERLYVLVWHGDWLLHGPGEFFGPVLGKSDDYRLYTFWLADGSELPPVRVKGGEKTIPPESIRSDLVRAVNGGVKVLDKTITFKGKDRVKE
jgi:hypothetical protein